MWNNEFVAVYVDECGERQILPFDSFNGAVEFFSNNPYICKIGIMTTAFYNHYIEKVNFEYCTEYKEV